MILEHKSIICAGYSAVMHIHCAAEEVTVKVSTEFFQQSLRHISSSEAAQLAASQEGLSSKLLSY